MRITDVKTYLVGNPWKNWLLVRLETDEGIYGVGEGTLNAFARTVETAIHELRDQYIGMDPSRIELLNQRMVRDVYTDGGQIHLSAVAAIELACWDIMGKGAGKPVYQLLGGGLRDRVRAYANGWYRHERTPERFAESAAAVLARGYTALKFDPFGAAYRVMDRRQEDLSIDIVAAVREAVGPKVDIMIEGHSRFSVATALRVAERLAPYLPAWFEEPVHHHDISGVVAVAQRSPIPVATGESFTSTHQFAALLEYDAVHIIQPEPLNLGGLWNTQKVCAMADARYAVVAPHNAQGPVCSAASAHLGACIPNFYVQESFDEFNDEWTRAITSNPISLSEGYVQVPDSPGLGVDFDWESLERYPYRSQNLLRLFEEGWEKRGAAPTRDN